MAHRMATLAGLLTVMALALIGWLALPPADAQSTPSPTPTAILLPTPALGALDRAAVSAIDLTAFPLVPEISQTALDIYLNGLARGNDPHSFIKVGDCMTHTPYFLLPIGAGQYDLGDYGHLARVVEQFGGAERNSFARESQAAAGGFNAASVLDSIWANPEFCQAGETPLACELRHMQPSVALIMFGTNDVQYLTEEQFDYFLRGVVVETVRHGTLPILSTFPHRPEFPEKTLLFNQIVAQIAQDYDLPLINLWLALEELPHQGVDPADPTHLTIPPSGAVCAFLGENLEAGFTVRNLLTLQALDAVLTAAEQR